jgi:hypothetical protein
MRNILCCLIRFKTNFNPFISTFTHFHNSIFQIVRTQA